MEGNPKDTVPMPGPWLACILAGIVLMLSPLFAFAELSIGGYELVSKIRVGRTTYEFTFRASVTNDRAESYTGVAATVTSLSATTTVVDGGLDFGDVPAGATLASSDTFTLRINRRFPFSEADLNWEVAGEVILTSVPRLLGLLQTEAEAALTDANLTAGDITEVLVITVPTGVVLAQDPAAGTEVPTGSAVELVLVQAPPAVVIIPEAWAGQWQLSITYQDLTTGNTVNVTEITDAICPGDPLGMSLAQQMFDALPDVTADECTGTATQDRIEAACAFQGSVATCVFDGSMQFGMDLDGDALSGTGAWALTAAGCDPPPLSDGQTFVLSGVRLSPDTGGLCAVPASSLLQKFLRNPLLPVLGVLP